MVNWGRRPSFRIDLDYPVDLKPRYGYGKPVHAALRSRIERNREFYRSSLRQFLAFADNFVRIPTMPADPIAPSWRNGFPGGLRYEDQPRYGRTADDVSKQFSRLVTRKEDIIAC